MVCWLGRVVVIVVANLGMLASVAFVVLGVSVSKQKSWFEVPHSLLYYCILKTMVSVDLVLYHLVRTAAPASGGAALSSQPASPSAMITRRAFFRSSSCSFSTIT